MSRPGSKRWWQETALITLAGAGLAAWLWDGWPFAFFFTDTDTMGAAPLRDAHWGDYLDAGCFTADNLRAMAEGQHMTVSCDHRRLLHTEFTDP